MSRHVDVDEEFIADFGEPRVTSHPLIAEASYHRHYEDHIRGGNGEHHSHRIQAAPGTSGQEQPSFSEEEAPADPSEYGEPGDLLHSPDSAVITACEYHLGVLLSQAIAQLDGTPQQAQAIRQVVQLLYQLHTRRP